MVKLTIDKYLDKRGITRYELAKRTEVKFQTIDRYYKNRVVRYDSYILDRICASLECDVCDIIEYVKDDGNPSILHAFFTVNIIEKADTSYRLFLFAEGVFYSKLRMFFITLMLFSYDSSAESLAPTPSLRSTMTVSSGSSFIPGRE